jgi:hypothetical protein
LNVIFRDQNLFRFLLISIGIIGFILIYYYASRKRKKALERPFIPSKNPTAKSESIAMQAPSFKTLQRPFGIWIDLLRAFLIVLSIIIAATSTLILLPQQTIDKIAHQLQSRHARSVHEQIALLYLGDALEDGKFRIRGVIKNITPTPIERLDATVRFIAQDGNTSETVLVRLDKENLAPNELARLDLVIPNYKMDISGYTVEFKLREGSKISYKDMRMDNSP